MKHSVLGAALGNAAAQHGYSPIQQALAAEFGENAGNIVGAGTSTIQARINNQIVSGSTTTNKPDVTVSAPKVPPSVLQTAPPSSAGPPGGGGPLFPNLTDAEIGIDIQAGTAVVGPVAKNPSTGEGLIAVPLPRFDANASIAHQETMIFRGIRGAGGQLVEVRRHSPNSRAPHGSYSRANPTTQVNTVKVDKSTGLPRTGPGGRTYSDKFMDPSGNFIRPKNDVEWQSVHSR